MRGRPLQARKRTAIIGVGIGVEKGIGTGIGMAFGHEKRDVYRAAIEQVGWKRTGRNTSTPIPIPTLKECHDRQQDG